jgi:hypothetical protein
LLSVCVCWSSPTDEDIGSERAWPCIIQLLGLNLRPSDSLVFARLLMPGDFRSSWAAEVLLIGLSAPLIGDASFAVLQSNPVLLLGAALHFLQFAPSLATQSALDVQLEL